LEFKSSLRTNLYTKEQDKKIEQAVAKALVAFLNTDGGTLLVGVDDKGEVLGIAHDTFGNNDRFHRHFSNVVKNYIGQEQLPYIRSALIKMKKDVYVLKVDCKKSGTEVFLKVDGAEEFYVRTGPSSVKLDGSKLLAYVGKRFGKRK
jgi:predicted HTH transcriptional regulator